MKCYASDPSNLQAKEEKCIGNEKKAGTSINHCLVVETVRQQF